MFAPGVQPAQATLAPTAQASALAASPAARVEPLERSGAGSSRQDARRERDEFLSDARARTPAAQQVGSVRREVQQEPPRQQVVPSDAPPDETVAALTRAVARGVRATMAYLRRVIDPDVVDGVSEMERQAIAKLSLQRVRELAQGDSVDPHPQVKDATPVEAPGRDVMPPRRGVVIDVRA